MNKANKRMCVLSEREVTRQCRLVFQTFAWAFDIRRNNVAQFTDYKGHKVRCGAVGEPDYLGQFRKYGGRWDGCTLGIEIKRSNFTPNRLRPIPGNWTKIKHWHEQLSCMHKINENGGVAFWTRDAGELGIALQKIIDGASVTIDDKGWPWLETD